MAATCRCVGTEREVVELEWQQVVACRSPSGVFDDADVRNGSCEPQSSLNRFGRATSCCQDPACRNFNCADQHHQQRYLYYHHRQHEPPLPSTLYSTHPLSTHKQPSDTSQWLAAETRSLASTSTPEERPPQACLCHASQQNRYTSYAKLDDLNGFADLFSTGTWDGGVTLVRRVQLSSPE